MRHDKKTDGSIQISLSWKIIYTRACLEFYTQTVQMYTTLYEPSRYDWNNVKETLNPSTNKQTKNTHCMRAFVCLFVLGFNVSLTLNQSYCDGCMSARTNWDKFEKMSMTWRRGITKWSLRCNLYLFNCLYYAWNRFIFLKLSGTFHMRCIYTDKKNQIYRMNSLCFIDAV